MISVYAEYGVVVKECGTEQFQYKTIEIKGHADNLEGTKGIKCCAGVSAIIIGFADTLETSNGYSYKFDNGLFTLINSESNMSDKQLNHYINLVLCQLYAVYQIYPQFFSKFETKQLFIKKGNKIEWKTKTIQ